MGSDTAGAGARRWRLGLAALVVLFVAALALSLVLADRYGSPVVDRDYYRRGLRYDAVSRGTASAAAGWSADCTLAGSRLRLTLRDRDGRPLTGAVVTFIPDRGAAAATSLTLTETAPGRYETADPVAASGTLRAERGGTVMTRRLAVLR